MLTVVQGGQSSTTMRTALLKTHSVREKPPVRRRWVTLFASFSIAALSWAAEASWQSLKSIESAALAHVEKASIEEGSRIETRIGSLDKRLRLAACSKALETFDTSPVTTQAVRTVGVRCNHPKPWKLYVPVRTVVYKSVAVSNHPLSKGSKITTADVRLEERAVNQLNGRYLTDLVGLQGKVLKRNVQGDTVIDQGALDQENVIQRGQSVTLVARSDQLQVRMRGEALDEAAINERVQVRNLSSQRIVEGVVASRQVVVVDY